jgi:hypothetical protein
MTNEKQINDNEDQSLIEMEAYRTGEEHNILISPDNDKVNDLEKIAALFKSSKPDPAEISEAVDNYMLERIKEKSREIRRNRKVVHLFPRYKWVAAAVMGVLVCVVSFNILYEKDKPVEKILSKYISTVPAGLSEEKDGKDYFAVNNNQYSRIKPAIGELKQDQPGLKMVSAETHVNNFKKEKPESIAAQSVKDIDGNGTIDIIDAYLLNKSVKNGAAISKQLDLNKDGLINNEDIDDIAYAAVSLKRREV